MRYAMNTRHQILAAALTGLVLTIPSEAAAAGKAKENDASRPVPAPVEEAAPRRGLRLGLPWRKKEKADPVPAAGKAVPDKKAKADKSEGKDRTTKTAAVQPEAEVKEKRGLFRGLLGRRGESAPQAVPDKKSAAAPEDSGEAVSEKRKLWSAPLAAVRKLRERPAAESAMTEKPERPDDWEDRFVVKEEAVPFYEFGPSQAGGPDMDLVSGMVVKEVKRERGGWAQVQLEGGRTGYIDASALRPAEKNDFLEPPPPVTQLAAASAGTPWLPAAPPPDLPDEAPLMDLDGALDLLPPLEQP